MAKNRQGTHPYSIISPFPRTKLSIPPSIKKVILLPPFPERTRMPHTHRTFRITADPSTGSTIPVRIQEPNSGRNADVVGLGTWSCSLVLANLLHKHRPLPRANATPFQGDTVARERDAARAAADEDATVDVLELGAGTGLAGLAAASLWRSPAVLLTDLPGVTPNLAGNAALNVGLLSAAGTSVSVGALDWDCPEDLVVTHPHSRFRLHSLSEAPLPPTPKKSNSTNKSPHDPRGRHCILRGALGGAVGRDTTVAGGWPGRATVPVSSAEGGDVGLGAGGVGEAGGERSAGAGGGEG